MIDKLETLSNDNVMVLSRSRLLWLLIVRTKRHGFLVAGHSLGIHSYWNSFNETSDFETAIEYFTPTIGNLIINQ